MCKDLIPLNQRSELLRFEDCDDLSTIKVALFPQFMTEEETRLDRKSQRTARELKREEDQLKMEQQKVNNPLAKFLQPEKFKN